MRSAECMSHRKRKWAAQHQRLSPRRGNAPVEALGVADRHKGQPALLGIGVCTLAQRIHAECQLRRQLLAGGIGRRRGRQVEQVPHTAHLGFQVGGIFGQNARLKRHAVHDLNALRGRRCSILLGLLVSSRTERTCRSSRIPTAAQYSRSSAGWPSSKLASTVSYPSSCRL